MTVRFFKFLTNKWISLALIIGIAAAAGLAVGFGSNAASANGERVLAGAERMDGTGRRPAGTALRASFGGGESGNRYVTAADGEAVLIDENMSGTSFRRLRTSSPVFRAFDISPDGKMLLYSPLRNGRPSGTLLLEDLGTGESRRVTSHIVLSASMSPADPNRIAYTLAGESGFGIGVSDLGTGGDAVLVDRDVFAEIVGWNDDGGSVRYFATAPTGSLRLRPAPGGRVFSGTGMGQPNDDESTLFAALDDEHELSLTAQEIDTETLTSNYAISDIPAGFPKVGRGSHVPLEFQPDAVGDGGTSTARSFTIRSADGVHSVSGDDIAGVGRIVIGGSGGDRTAVPGPAVLSKVLRNGLIVKEFEPDRTVTKYVNWAGEATQLGATAVNYHLPEANSTMVQGGAAYSSPEDCNVSVHMDNMAYAYDFRDQTVDAHALAVADGLVVFTSSTMACNFLQQSCPDYSANGCPGSIWAIR